MAGAPPAARAVVSSQLVGYAAALLAPIAMTYTVSWLAWPPFIFEHLVILLVLAIAVPWGLAPAVIAAVVSVGADNVLLREPVGQPTISGFRDVIDLGLFALVAVVVSALVRRAHAARLAAEAAADRERRARDDRDRLVATIAHDLATPLAVLSGTVQTVRRRGDDLQTELPRLVTRLETASARATSLVRTLADAQALDANDFTLRLQTSDLRLLVAPIVEMMDRFSERHPVMLTLPETPVLVHGDVERLQTVVENLVSNAIKYSPEGGVVEVSVTCEGSDAVLSVRDHGIGISAAALPHIFERAYRAPDVDPSIKGLGLGLTICAHVVARHGGRIAAAPAERAGTVFTVRLPMSSATGFRHPERVQRPVSV